jgi:hypothetical protein
MAANTNPAASKNGAPGTPHLASVLMNTAKVWVNTLGPMRLARPMRLASAPCRRPCSWRSPTGS